MSESTDRQRQVAIIGGGTMGGDIAVVFLAGGWTAHVISPSSRTRDGLPGRIGRALAAVDARPEAAAAAVLHGALDDIDWAHVDLVVEAVTEDLGLKQDLFRRIEQRVSPETPIATNTSNFAIGRVGEALRHKHRLLGTHFFMPAHLVPLVEVVSSEHTDAAVAQSMLALLQGLGKMPIWVRKDVPGFVGNRIQHAMMREALYLLEDGVATAEEIDTAVRFGFGFRFMACGPILQKEMSGWDTNSLAAAALYPHLHNEACYPPGLERRVKQGRTGMKALHGIWEWTEADAAQTKARIERRLRAALALLEAER
jgi:3-hydroxybutyryl-CoA dehydrogenase